MGEWAYNPSVQIPSCELLEFFSVEMLYGLNKGIYSETAADKEIQPTMRKFIRNLRVLEDEERITLVAQAVARMKLWHLVEEASDTYWWHGIATLYTTTKPLDVSSLAGFKMVTCHLTYLMTTQAIIQKNAARLESLAQVVRQSKHQEKSHASNSRIIAFQSFRWRQYLVEKLGRNPTASEMQHFLLTIYPDITDHPTTWSEARRLLPISLESVRKRKIDSDQIQKIALIARQLESRAINGKGPDPTLKKTSRFRNAIKPPFRRPTNLFL